MDPIDSRVVRAVRSLRRLRSVQGRQPESDSESTSTGSSTPLGGDSRPSTDQLSQAVSLNPEFLSIPEELQLSLSDFVHILQSDTRLTKSNSHPVVMSPSARDGRRLKDRVREVVAARRIREARETLSEKISKRMQDLEARLHSDT